jgi:phenylacetate-CoA ligase
VPHLEGRGAPAEQEGEIVIPGTLLQLHRLRKEQWLDTERLLEIQRQKLRKMLKHAYENVPYYRRLFDSVGVKPEEIKTIEDLTKIPITKKLELARLPLEEITARGTDLRKCVKRTTSGSTGILLSVYFTKEDEVFCWTVWARAFLDLGQRPWHKLAYVQFASRPRTLYERLGIYRKYFLQAGGDPEDQVKRLAQIRPDIIRGYGMSIGLLARTTIEKGVSGITPRLVFTSGNITDSAMRMLIETAFRAKAFDFYGAEEVGCIAWECPERAGYHINIDTLVVELVKDGRAARPGEIGRVVCTGLHSFAMPIIRYELGDVCMATDKKCSCGRGLPLLSGIEGRLDDLFVSPGGRVFTSPSLLVRIRHLQGIDQYRIIQETVRDIRVLLVPRKGFSEDTLNEVRKIVEELMGNEYNLRIDVVDAIPADASGKFRTLISKVKKEF